MFKKITKSKSQNPNDKFQMTNDKFQMTNDKQIIMTKIHNFKQPDLTMQAWF